MIHLPGDGTLGALEVGLGATGIAATAAAGWLYGAMSPESQLFGKTVPAGDDADELALTYDDGPNIAATPQLLDILASTGVCATFFVVGKFVRDEPQLTRRIAAAGHTIGNHTMMHPMLCWKSASRIRAELTNCNKLLEDTLGQPIRLFRPPFGARRPAVFEVAAELKLKVVLWNAMGRDWVPRSGAEIVKLVEQGMERNRQWGRGTNILLHDGDYLRMGAQRLPTVEATRMIIESGLSAGRRFVTPEAWL